MGLFRFFSDFFVLGVDSLPSLWLDNDMTTNNTTAHSIYELIADMADARRRYAAENGFEASDAEIADSIKASLIRMMSA